MQARHADSSTHYNGPLDCLRKIHRTEGIRGLMRGIGITLLRDVPSIAVYFAAYEWILRVLCPNKREEVRPQGGK